MSEYFYKTADSVALQYLRDMQIKELKGTAQDATEEGIVTYHADFVRIMNGNETVGYVCIGTHSFYQDMILEYYLISRYRADAAAIIRQVIKTYKCRQWLVNTHDFFALPVMLDLRLNYQIDAYKFTTDDSIRVEYNLGSEITIELTAPAEINEVYPLIMQDGFYSGGDINTALAFISAKEMYSLRKNDRLIGVGFVGTSKRTPSYADIAMIIDRDNRRNGYGVLLVSALVAKCRLLNLIPTAVCDVNNEASRKVLQKTGFYLDGCLLLAQVDVLNGTG